MKIREKHNIAESRFLNLVRTVYEDKTGQRKEWISAERPGNQNAVVIVAIVPGDDPDTEDNTNPHPNPRLVVIKEFRIPLQDYEYGCAAGLIDYGESPEETAKRELFEETGLKIKKILRKTRSPVFSSAGLTNESTYMFFVEAEGTINLEKNESSEDIQIFLLNRKQVKIVIENPDNKIGAKAYLVFLRFAEDGVI
jgi:ADP-ribose pyrophosphatase